MRGKTIRNTSPLITLACAEGLHSLQLAFQQLIISQTVHEELVEEGNNWL